MMPRSILVHVATLGSILLWSACPSESPTDPLGDTTSDLQQVDADAGAEVATETDDGGAEPSPWASPEEENDWRIVFNYRNRTQTGQNELWIAGAFGENKQSITDLASLDVQDPPLSCEYGCFISEDMRWVAITTGPPTAKGFSFRVGSFTNANLDFKLIKDLVLADKVDFKFAGNRLFHTTESACVGASCQYNLEFRDLNTPAAVTSLLIYPTAEELEQSTYAGHFKAGPKGEKLILLNTTIRSVTVNLYKVGTGLVELDFLCKYGTKSNCQGTGSEYSDIDPVGISPDGKYAVFFTFSESEQRANVYDLDDPGGTKYSTVLASVSSGSYIEKACDFGVLKDWQWQKVISDPVFTPDGSEIIFLTETNCLAPNGSLPIKPRRDLIRIKLETLLAELPITEDDVFNITQNPVMGSELGATRDNVVIEGFRVAPDGATVVFTGTPIFEQGGDPLPDDSTRTRNDNELFRIRLDAQRPSWQAPAGVLCDGPLCQLSNDLSWQAQSPRIVPPSGAF